MKRRKSFLLSIIAAALTLTALAGCGSSDNAENVAATGKAGSSKAEAADGSETGSEAASETGSEDAASKDSVNENSKEKEKVELHLADMSVYGIAIFNYAEEIGLLKGYFDDTPYDVNVTLSEWASGVDQNTAFAAGEIDFSSMGNIPAVTGASNGIGTKILGVNYLYDDEYVLVVRSGSGVEKVSDLKGKNVGTYVGTVAHYAIAKYLEAGGLSVGDVNLLNIGAEAETALRNGDIDAAVLGNVVAHQIEKEGTGKILSTDQVPIYNYVVGREEYYSKYPEITKKVLHLINETWAYALEHKDEYIKFYADKSGTDVEVVKASWAEKFPIKSAKDFDEKDYELYVGFVDWMKSVEYVSADLDPDTLLDRKYVQELNL
ncbi:MAG: ABC transporter substrate-binding protein [Ruminococcus sp.]|nr:ABC transporter substrate-binding protein [Ruminococcus sp.]